MARDTRYKLVKRYDGVPSHFFDLHADPDECIDKFDDPARQAQILKMTRDMNAFFQRYQDSSVQGLRSGGPQPTNMTSPWSRN